MTRTTPDYSNVRAYGQTHRLDDLAEAVCRLGSVDTFHRQGRVIYIDDFSQGIPQWGSATYGTGAEFGLSTYRALSPPYSLRFRTGGDGACGSKGMIKLPYRYLSKMGLEYSFTHEINSLYHFMEFHHWDGTTKRTYRILFDIQADTIKLYDHNGVYQEIVSGRGLASDGWLFHTAKLVMDLENNRYDRFYHNDKDYDISDYLPYEEAQSSVPFLEIAIQFTGDVGSNRVHYVDNLIVTQGEP